FDMSKATSRTLSDGIFTYNNSKNYDRIACYKVSTDKTSFTFPMSVSDLSFDVANSITGTVSYENGRYLFTGTYKYNNYNNGEAIIAKALDLQYEGIFEKTGLYSEYNDQWTDETNRIATAIFGRK
ncbi:MAG: hypothetical protein Q4E61_03070, partial [Alphaproteobacteria bacterium]|nr:hypothetical protein [Alphaproteobacteria bacterium]